MTTYCRFCLKNEANPWAPVYFFIQTGIHIPDICKACDDYLDLVDDARMLQLITLAARYANARGDVARSRAPSSRPASGRAGDAASSSGGISASRTRGGS
jgi:hypothetical protein